MSNLKKFKGTYTYASELFGLYLPLLGWGSRQGKQRVYDDSTHLLIAVMMGVQKDGRYYKNSGEIFDDPVPKSLRAAVSSRLPAWLNSTTVARLVQTSVNAVLEKHKRPPTPDEWRQLLSNENIGRTMKQLPRKLILWRKRLRLRNHAEALNRHESGFNLHTGDTNSWLLDASFGGVITRAADL
ncbi:hypothetical protein [Candidatus Nitrotoga sp. M5]|uniref:hypothetical protein n=1 Tax=Candidatus Nitrotoga sp. M5 TaxID=2890409 RepID=UPI001EF2153B|nr:hypothetical protein [Candidatus Nitrotoga sp. M5]CAH1386958.1 hypothetical protein NTGM5_400022 [Candidatus Nitrotoga sp. M5]